MLKALELSGFKSFADKTRFEFPHGITVVVGPNGSGKSNIVDAIKWVLGEQSAKSLRGKEMADVIFKGSGGPNGRKPANSATATIFLDNSDRRFAYDADEVTIGRRVYRSGEAEYLINGETCRLKDIRNLFRGTGIGTDAYSLIEQGKVDRLLQASAKDRRAIFEEAAGISRFKAKKIEAQRRLERVDANLIRLADIVDEVGNRYRSVKAQASKAARYKEYSDRLKELRTFVGLKDWRSFTERLEEIDRQNAAGLESIDEAQKKLAEFQQQLENVDQRLSEVSTEHQTLQEAVTETREEIAQTESQIELNRSRLQDVLDRREGLESQQERAKKRFAEYQLRLEKNRESLENSELEYASANQQLQQLDAQMAEVLERLEQLESESTEWQAESNSLLEQIAQAGRAVSAADSQHQQLDQSRSQLEARHESDQAMRRQLVEQLEAFEHQRQELEQQAAERDSDLAAAQQRLTETRQSRQELESRIAALDSKHSGITQRTQVLQELEEKLEGVNAGAKQLLNQARQATQGPLNDIVGVVADLIQVNVQHAGIVDVALGDVAQYLIVDGERLIDALATEEIRVQGRVGVIRVDRPPTLGADPDVNLNGQPGIIGRADRLVQVAPGHATFVHRLLGGTWLVKSLADALRLHQAELGHVRFVTLDGEIVESDGTVVVGPKTSATGLVSRRSELRSLNQQLAELTNQRDRARGQLEEIQQAEADADEDVQRLIGENTRLANQLSEISVRAGEAKKQLQSLDEQLQQHSDSIASIVAELGKITAKLTADRTLLAAKEKRLADVKQGLQSHRQELDGLRNQRVALERELTRAKVGLAKFEQRLLDIQNRQQQTEQEFDDVRLEAERLQQQLESDRQVESAAQKEIEEKQRRLEELQLRRQELTEQLEAAETTKNEQESIRRELNLGLNAARDELRQAQDQIHHLEIRAEQLRMERQRLAERLQEDYGIDIATVQIDDETEEQQAEREAIDQEITELRQKIGSIGSVNLDALAELEELESRYLAMDEQYQDLVAAKESLERIIQRINNDSRRLFVETLEAIRANFQKLFRQTFGGGKADILLEEGVDPLEAGVEIVATPPGKPQFSNSLLSGGEKALTAVSLLMAIFQFRPSPFCVLDEVDAPFDEANIGRFIEVLKSFLGWTRFVIVTHSKKTMTAATTLYGVTMQESGVSKRVSVRFEDVSEDGHISEEALRRQTDEEAA